MAVFTMIYVLNLTSSNVYLGFEVKSLLVLVNRLCSTIVTQCVGKESFSIKMCIRTLTIFCA